MSTSGNYNNNTLAVHQLLESHPDGLTSPDMAEILSIRDTNINAVVKRSPRIYIDRWEARSYNDGKNCSWLAVYCLVQTPVDAPKPDMKPSAYLKAMKAKGAAHV